MTASPKQRKAEDSSASAVTAFADLDRRYQAVFNSTYQFMGVIHRDGWVLDVNDAALAFAGVTREAIIGRRAWETPWFAHSVASARRLREALQRARQGGLVRYEETVAGNASARAEIDFSLKPVLGTQGTSCLLIAEGRDLTERQLARSALAQSEEQLRLSFDLAPTGKALVDLDGSFLKVNDALCSLLGYEQDELVRMGWGDISHPDDAEVGRQLAEDTIAGKRRGYRLFKRYRHRVGHWVHVQLDVNIARDAEGTPLYFIAQIQDVSARRRAEEALFEAKELAQVTLAAIGDGVVRTDANGVISYVNDSACTLLGRPRNALVGQRFGASVMLYPQEGDDPLPDPVDHLLRLGVEFDTDTFPRLATFGGARVPVRYTLKPMVGRDGGVLGCVFVVQDVSDASQLNARWEHQARHDSLTGLLNRRAFEDALAECSDSLAEGGELAARQHALIYFDFDHFKIVNDSCGHSAGDRMLVELSRLLRRRLRSGDQLARLGGDEFAALLLDCTLEDAQLIAGKLLEAARAFRFDAGERRFGVTLSIGVTAVGASVDETLARADTACYVAKHDGGNRVHVSHERDAGVRRMRREMDWANQLQAALSGEADRLVLQQQAIVSLTDGAVHGHEILLRFRRDDGELVVPEHFLPAARRLGLMPQIDRFVLAGVVEAVGAGRAPEGPLWINLSAASITDPCFEAEAMLLLDAAGLGAERLNFEIAEGGVAGNALANAPLVSALRHRGHGIWLDDFGTGFDAFETLRLLRPDGIKIEGRTVMHLESEPVYRHLLDAACAAMRDMNGTVLAEGVENEAAKAELRRRGVVLAQGYALAGIVPLGAG